MYTRLQDDLVAKYSSEYIRTVPKWCSRQSSHIGVCSSNRSDILVREYE